MTDQNYSWLTDFEAAIKDGAEIDKRTQQLVDRLHAYTNLVNTSKPPTEQLIEAVTDGAPAEQLNHLHYLATAVDETNPVARGMKVRSEVTDALTAAIRKQYQATTGEKNYIKCADTYKTLAKEYRDLAAIIDPHADTHTLVDGTEEQRTAWSRLQILTTELDQALEATARAARIAGKPTSPKDWLISVAVNPKQERRRAIWAAWESEDKWYELNKLNIDLKAPPLNTLAPYREPKPMRIQYVKEGMGTREVIFDPEVLGDDPTLEQLLAYDANSRS